MLTQLGLQAVALVTLLLPLAILEPAHAQDVPRARLEPMSKALDFLQIDHRFSADGTGLWFDVPTKRYGLPDSMSLRLIAFPFKRGTDGPVWFQLKAAGIYSLTQCARPDAARRAVLESGWMLSTDVQFLYDSMDGSVDAQVAIPASDGKLGAKLVGAYIEMLVEAIDGIDPVIRRAMESGLIDWPKLDRGPTEAAGILEIGTGEAAYKIAWAPWIERQVFASSIVASDGILRKLLRMNDEQRERFGRDLTRFGEGAGTVTFGAWMQISDHVEQRYPPIAFRFWGPEGAKVSATATVRGFCGETTASGTIDVMGLWDVDLTPEWDLEALTSLKERRTVQIEFTVACEGHKATGTRDVVIEPVSVSDNGLDFLGVPQYVNEDHPWVPAVISEARSLGIAESLGRTGQESYEDCVKQVYAIWTALRNRGLTYVTIHNTSAAEAQPCQTIRQFHDAISDQGANCADGSAAIASLLRKLGFRVWFVYPKGHVFVAVETGVSDGNPEHQWLFLETTMLGDVEPTTPPGSQPERAAEGSLAQRHRNEDWATFLNACASAREQAEKGRASWALLDELRKEGMKPIPASRANLGRIPDPPKDLEATRSGFREVKRAERRRMDYLFADIRAPRCDPYGDAAQAQSDIDSVERDADALRRLLASVEGDGPRAELARLRASHYAMLRPAISAAMTAFGRIERWGAETLGVSGSPWTLEVDRQKGIVRVTVQPNDRQTPDSWVEVRQNESGWCVTEDSLMPGEPWLFTAFVNAGLQDRPEGLNDLSERLQEGIRSKQIADADAFMTALDRGLAELFPSDERLQQLADGAAAVGAKGAKKTVIQLEVSDDRQGQGPGAKAGDAVDCHYVCSLENGTVIFDSRKKDGKVRTFIAGQGRPCKGVGSGLVGARSGAVRTILVPPDLGFGRTGLPKNSPPVPPNAVLRYELTIIAVRPAK